jgi:uncharacterized repeat protein (TIGR01451 family)
MQRQRVGASMVAVALVLCLLTLAGVGGITAAGGMPAALTAGEQLPDFTDVTSEMGAGAPGYGTAVAWGDYDGDGDLDLYVVNLGPSGLGQANVLLRNDGETFTDVTAEAGVGDGGPGVAAAWADMDNDGDLDLFVSNRPGDNALYQNEGAGQFAEIGVAAGVSDYYGMGEGAAWADDDRDGLVDLYVANYTGAAPPYNKPNRLFRNLGENQFEDVAAQRLVAHTGNGEGIAWADFDNDGDQDLYVANASGANVLYQRRDDGTFEDVTGAMHVPGGPGSSFGAAWGDYDNDGWLDLYVAQQGANKLYRNLGGTDFADVSTEAGVAGNRFSLGCAWGDFDNDGRLDLHVAHADISGYDPGDVLYHNEGGTPVAFSDVTEETGVVNQLDARGSAWGDYDNDGDLDLYVVNQGTGQTNRLFRNNGTLNHWLTVSLIGCSSNRSGIGARVLVTGDSQQIREISGGSGFASQDSLPAEFGLSSWDGPVAVDVQWPSGGHTSLAGVAVDAMVMVHECRPDLSGATKSVDVDAALPGEALTYTIAAPNAGDRVAQARITDSLPLSVTWAGHLTATAGTPTWDEARRRVLWEGVISEGHTMSLTYRVTLGTWLAPGVTITNTAAVDDGCHAPFETPPATVTVLCQGLTSVGFTYEPLEPLTDEVITFTASATGTAPIAFAWDLGDGSTDTGQVIAHSYAVADDYPVTMTATNPCSQTVTAETISVQPSAWRIYLPLILRDGS